MQTFTFYSYKGGSGRTLLLANVARQMSLLGLRTFAIDLDLEAPGLHHKLRLDYKEATKPFSAGVVDYLHSAAAEKVTPQSLRPYVFEINRRKPEDGLIHLMPAGNVVSKDYWHKLSDLDFRKMFYSDMGEGVPIFLELKARIEEEFQPDFLLIDARTGITELGGVSTAIMPDTVICLLLNNRETLEGARTVLRGIGRAVRETNQPNVSIVPVMSRIPFSLDPDHERDLLTSAQDFLNQPADDIADTLSVANIVVLHSEPDIEVREILLVGGDKKIDQSPLLRDYLRLLTVLIPSQLILPRLSRLIETASEGILERPDEVESELQRLTVSFPHPETYTALLKYYRVRNKEPEACLQVANLFWQMTRKADEYPIIWGTVKKHLPSVAQTIRVGVREFGVPLDFVENVWRDQGANDIEIGLVIADLFERQRRPQKALRVVQDLFAATGADEKVVVSLMNRLAESGQIRNALELAERVKTSLPDAPRFYVSWGRLIVRFGNGNVAQEFLERLDSRAKLLLKEDLGTYGRLLTLAGKAADFDPVLEAEFDAALRHGVPVEKLVEFGGIYSERGRSDDFKRLLQEKVPGVVEEVMRYMSRSASGGRSSHFRIG